MKIKDLHKVGISIVTDEYLVLICNSCYKVWLFKKPENGKIPPRDWHCSFNYCNHPAAKRYYEREMEAVKSIEERCKEQGIEIEPF